MTKYHCLFEQSGTFKNEFKKLGLDAFDYDILNNFGQTDFQIDLFSEIEKAYDGKSTIFDKWGGKTLFLRSFLAHDLKIRSNCILEVMQIN